MSIIEDEYAVYLPAVNTIYAQALIREPDNQRPYPKLFELEDLEFWRKGSKLWHHPHFLHSVGQYPVGSVPYNAVTKRGRSDGVLFGDSGGFQIGKGKLAGIEGLEGELDPIEACRIWRDAYEARQWILEWLETHTNYAMTIDMPLWATTDDNAGTPFHRCSHDQLTQLTVENLKFIDSHRHDRTKWLNVIQGFDLDGMTKWWKAVKWFPCSGYALSSSGAKMTGMKALLEPLLMMRDDKAFVKGRDWIHMLGVSTAPWAVMFTSIQRAMRAHVNPNMRISFDSSSPFQQAARYERYAELPQFGSNPADWAIKFQPTPQSRKHVNSGIPLPFTSPIADKLRMGDLNVRDGTYEHKQFDQLSLAFIANHNVWVYLEAFRIANDLLFAGDRVRVPSFYAECVDLIDHVFKAENWSTALENEAGLLNQFTG